MANFRGPGGGGGPEMDFSPSPESDNSGYYRNRNRNQRDDQRDQRGNRGRSKERHYRNRYSRSRSRSYSRERYISGNNRRQSPERDLYRDLIDQDYGDNSYDNRDRYRHRSRDRDRRSSRDRDRDRRGDRDGKSGKRGFTPQDEQQMPTDFDDNYDSDNNQEFFYQQKPNNKIIVRGLAAHITEADINSDLIQCGLQALHVRLIRRKKTGASRGFAFVEFRTEEEATRWICYKQGMLIFNDHRAIMQYTYSLPAEMRANQNKPQTDWYCAKCGVFNFKRRENCFKCFASREESEKGGEGSDEISSILTKKIMLRNLDVLTNEESVLCAMQEKIPDLVSKISKIMVCRDPLTQTSRGICYLHFDNLLDSMNTHNALKDIEPILKIDNREVLITYCMDTENRNLVKSGKGGQGNQGNGNNYQDQSGSGTAAGAYPGNYQYTMADVPRLAEYSASVYASNPTEHEHYLQFYTNYYVTQISQGQMNNFPTEDQLGETANSGAAVAQSALARKQGSKGKSDSSGPATVAPLQIPNGMDGKKYPTPDVTQYQYDETSGFYYDPSTGLYYDSNSQYYYNNEICSYLYWDSENSTYVVAPTSTAATTAATSTPAATMSEPPPTDAQTAAAANGEKPEKSKTKEQPQDKVKVAKKIVKDMERWAKQLNQKKDYSVLQPPAKVEEATLYSSQGQISVKPTPGPSSSGYADVGFSLLEKKQSTQAVSNFLMTQAKVPTTKPSSSTLVSSYGSDSDNDADGGGDAGGFNEADYVDFDKLTCLLCKRAFQSHEILNKHLKMSSLHKENMQKMRGAVGGAGGNAANNKGPYRDRAKERRLKYGEADPPPVNKSKERFQRELEKQTAAATPNLAAVPIGENNVGNKLLQKMGWSEGMGLGRSNQGRTNIIETETRVQNAGLGIKASHYGATGDDYKTYIKKMMKSRYEQA